MWGVKKGQEFYTKISRVTLSFFKYVRTFVYKNVDFGIFQNVYKSILTECKVAVNTRSLPIGHILKAGLDPGLWTLDPGLWTLDSGLWTLDSGLFLPNFTPPKKTSISPPIKLPFPQKKFLPPNKKSTTSDFF